VNPPFIIPLRVQLGKGQPPQFTVLSQSTSAPPDQIACVEVEELSNPNEVASNIKSKPEVLFEKLLIRITYLSPAATAN
jgi:hypothetical protein